jgi:hypothetical protein
VQPASAATPLDLKASLKFLQAVVHFSESSLVCQHQPFGPYDELKLPTGTPVLYEHPT